jgi:hypothetical protein
VSVGGCACRLKPHSAVVMYSLLELSSFLLSSSSLQPAAIATHRFHLLLLPLVPWTMTLDGATWLLPGTSSLSPDCHLA